VISISSEYLLDRHPSKVDSRLYKKNVTLITSEPTRRNHATYYSLACALWELGKLAEAEKMFLKIMDSKDPYYIGMYHHASDIPGDVTISSSGYGSYTSNYKNYACRYLTKIYIEEKKFEHALKYIEWADKVYTVEQNCGTGYRWYRSEIDGLYGLCYEGLERYDSIINMFLPRYGAFGNEILIRAIRQVYSQTEINEQLEIAERTIVFVPDTFQSSTFITDNYGKKNETTTEIKYTSGTATMSLFGRQVTLQRPDLENGASATKEVFMEKFKTSWFYISLSDNG